MTNTQPEPADSANRALLYAVLAGIIAVLVLTGWLILRVVGPASAPQTAGERELQQLEVLASRETTNAELWSSWATALVLAGQYGKADTVIAEAKSRMKSAATLDVALARLQSARGQRDLALKTLDSLMTAMQKQMDAKRAEAEKNALALSNAVLAPPGMIEALVLKGTLLLEAGRPDDAVEAYTAALMLDEGMADVMTMRGDAYAAAGRADKARADYEEALKRIPGYADAIAGLERLGKDGK